MSSMSNRVVALVLAVVMSLSVATQTLTARAVHQGVSIADLSADGDMAAVDTIAARTDLVAWDVACNPPSGGDHVDDPGEDLAMTMAARLAMWDRQCSEHGPTNLERVKADLLRTKIKAVGTDAPAGPCSIVGGYDEFLLGLMDIVYRSWELLAPSRPGEPDVQRYITGTLFKHRDGLVDLPLAGPHDSRAERRFACLTEVPESENHLLMIEVCRYLINQKLFEETKNPYYDNELNGMNEWMLRHLQVFAQHDFLEFNSRSYQRYSIHALMTLYDFAADQRVKTAAQIVLDYTTMKFATSSNMLRRAGPFRRLTPRTDRRNGTYFHCHSDPQTMFFLLWTGQSKYTDGMIPACFQLESLMAGLTSYRPPRAALELVMHKPAPYEARYFHGQRPRLVGTTDLAGPGVEIYSSSASFLLTAGGVWQNSGYGKDNLFRLFTGKDENYANPQATTLIPTNASVAFGDLIRFDGFPSFPDIKVGPATVTDEGINARGRVNTCVAGGFACGVNLRVPPRWDCASRVEHGAWLFLDLTRPPCGELGLFVAVHRGVGVVIRCCVSGRAKVETVDGAGDVGFLHAVEAPPGADFALFVSRTLAANGDLPPDLNLQRDYVFRSADGHTYTFTLDPVDDPARLNAGLRVAVGRSLGKYDPRVRAVDGQARGPFSDLPLVDSPYLTSRDHSGYLEIRRPGPSCAGSPGVLDFTNPLHPTRTVAKCAPVLTYTGDTVGDYHDEVVLAVKLTDPGTPSGITGAKVTITMGSQTCADLLTGPTGEASCHIVLQQPADKHVIQASFAGNDDYTAAKLEDCPIFAITPEEATLNYTGPSRLANGIPVVLSAVLLEDGTVPVDPPETVSFALGGGRSGQSCSAQTGRSGTATCTIPTVAQPLDDAATVPLNVAFDGDGFYRPASTRSEMRLEFVTADASGLTVTGDITGVKLSLPATPRAGPVRSASVSSTAPPCALTVPLAPLLSKNLCATVTTDLGPGTATGKASVADVRIDIPGLPPISIVGLVSLSSTTCAASSATTTLRLTMGSWNLDGAPGPNTTVQLPGGGLLVLNEQRPTPDADRGLSVIGVHLLLSLSTGNAEVVLASATTAAHNCT